MTSSDGLFWQAVEFIDQGDAHGLLSHLRSYPLLVNAVAPDEEPARPAYFAHPTLVHYLPDNPIRTGSVSDGCLDCLDVLVGMGAGGDSLNETLGLACSSKSLADSGHDNRLISGLIQAGASPVEGCDAALGHKMIKALEILVSHGLPLTLPVRVALDQDCPSELISSASIEDLQKSLAVAAIWGQSAQILALVSAGADPSAHCPPDFHSHSTPLHQAVVGGSQETALALVKAGASLLARDLLWGATPLGWAEFMGIKEMADLLEPLQNRAANP